MQTEIAQTIFEKVKNLPLDEQKEQNGDSRIGTLLLLNLFRDQMQKGETAPDVAPTNETK